MPFSFITQTTYSGFSYGKKPTYHECEISNPFLSYWPLSAVAVLPHERKSEVKAGLPVPVETTFKRYSFSVSQVSVFKTFLLVCLFTLLNFLFLLGYF